MPRNYFITALRNLKRNKVYTFLNIFGLALGIGCALVVYKVISYEFSYDTQHENYDNIYRVVTHNIYPDEVDKGMGTPTILLYPLKHSNIAEKQHIKLWRNRIRKTSPQSQI